ncbi:IS4 family transposase [Thorsellia kenyensis]|uniref:IS4 family transposase n=1 Tax=Thorsellia kenyensis TaxID=1549888 RepID=A0ABV6C6D0_9GAMM
MSGRFTKTAPAAIECHLTMDLVKGVANYIALDADKESEKNYRPSEKGLKETLVMMDAGYFDIGYLEKISKSGGFFIVRAKANINPLVVAKYNKMGTKLSHKEMKLKELKTKNHDFVDMDVKWAKTNTPLRIIQFYDRKRKGKGYLITNLDRDQFKGNKVLSLYGLRWQIELFFKELKSFCSLKKVNTGNANIVKTLIWASILTLIVKRYVALSVCILWQTIISTQKTCRSSLCWFPKLMNYLNSDEQDMRLLDEIFIFISKNCGRSNTKRDKETEMFTSGLIPYFQIKHLESELHKKRA